MAVWLASRNVHKITEFTELLRPYGVAVRPLPSYVGESPENGRSFIENATQKAMFYGQQLDGWVLADDSGVCVDALHGQPGIYSARFAGQHGDDAANNEKLLSLLYDAKDPKRTAQFICALALWNREVGVPTVAQGEVAGRIVDQAAGRGGFGYDPLFEVDGLRKTFAQLDGAEKNQYSHRAVAVRQLMARQGGDGVAYLRGE